MVKLKTMRDMSDEIEDDEVLAADLEESPQTEAAEAALVNVSKVSKAGAKRKRGKSDALVEEEQSVPSKMAKGKSKRQIRPLLFKRGIPYMYYTGEDFYGMINICSRTAYYYEIRQKLSHVDWLWLKDGPFGKVLEMIQQVSFSSQTIHVILMKQLDSGKKYETWYDVCCKESRFSMKEFNLITGLNCGEGRVHPRRGEKTAMTNFFNKATMSVNELFERFIHYVPYDFHKLQMAMLLIVEGILLGGDKKRLVNPLHVKLLERTETFYEYPWERVAYLELHKSLTTSLSRRMEASNIANQVAFERRIPYSLQGLPLVFQVWVWEVARGVGRQYCHRVEGDRFPRGIRWYSNDALERGALGESFGEKHTVVKAILFPESADEEKLLKECEFEEEENVHQYFDKIVADAIAAREKSKGVVKKNIEVDNVDLNVVDVGADDPVREDPKKGSKKSAPAGKGEKKVGKKVEKEAPKKKAKNNPRKKATMKGRRVKIDEVEGEGAEQGEKKKQSGAEVEGEDDDEEEKEDDDDDANDGGNEDKGGGGAYGGNGGVDMSYDVNEDKTVEALAENKEESENKEDGNNIEVQNDAIMEENVAQPVGIIETVEQVFQVVNDVMKDVCGSQGADGNQGEGGDIERTEIDDVCVLKPTRMFCLKLVHLKRARLRYNCRIDSEQATSDLASNK